MNDRFMNYKQTLKYLNIHSYNTLYKYIKDGLPVVVIGKAKRIDKNKLDEFISSRTIKEV
ncbi:DNA-binding protein [Apilactobacillus micheneri]|uniref:helix-turn-helix transcriptional regulator n=1 Tax=Apilactobacillus micheneri TaxID=1899430 RepID=UPI00112C2BDD|nr:helix-turn-helix domain-containing protein [Apilactobacillus micheneri]TPR43577.1 DNA-binding protein [Apilactobacillus micheneri]TPR47527.1 DNA-binding protein [Apilactobacillus micheneri]